jgi:RNA polymerase sigma-70 factor, ECF subfamily
MLHMMKRNGCRLESPRAGMLREEDEAADGDGTHVHSGRQEMSGTDTRVSVIVGVCRQDPERWREFDAIYRPMVFAYLLKRGVQQSDAGDLVQDIFVKLFLKIGTYDRSRSTFRSWLFSIAHNALVDRARRRAAYTRAVDGWIVNVLGATPSDSQRMADEWRKIHRQKILEHALKTVRARTSTKAWRCFEDRMLHNRPAADTAAELGIEPGSVYVNCSRVLAQVRDVCNEFDEDISDGCESGMDGSN